MWFHTLRNALMPAPRRRLFAGRLGVESLEDRCVPASLSISDVSLIEGNAGTQNALVTVTLTGARNSPASVEYSTLRDTALSGSDYQAVSGKLTFPKGVTSKTISIPVFGDAQIESSERFFVNLSNARKATITDGQGVVTINNDDTQIRIFDAWQSEGNSGTTSFDLTVNLSVPIGLPLTLGYATADGGTATPGSDYQPTLGNLTIPAGQTSGKITIQVNGDQVSEPDETFFMNISNPSTGSIANAQATGHIVDDEPHVYISGVYTTEGTAGMTAFNFVVSLSAPSADLPVTVDFATTDMTATVADNDYLPTNGTLTFTPGQTSQNITVFVNGDSAVELDEHFAVNLSNATNARFDNDQAFGTILSDDNAVLHIDSYEGLEPDPYYGDYVTFAFTVWLSTPFTETVTVNYTTVDDWAVAWWDYVPDSGQLTFNPGDTSQTIYISILLDYESEWTESFYVVLSDPSSNALIQPGGDLAVGTIYDNQGYWY